MTAVELVVPVADQQEAGNGLDSTREQPEHIERGLVAAVDVVEHEDRRGPHPQLTGERSRDLVRPRPRGDDLRQFATGRLGDVEERAERTRREQRVAGPPQHSRHAGALIAEAMKKRRLADPGLPSDEDNPSPRRAPHRCQALGEHRELPPTLEQVARGAEGRRHISHDTPHRAPVASALQPSPEGTTRMGRADAQHGENPR